MHIHPTLYPMEWHSNKGTASTVDPALDYVPGTHHCRVDRGSVGSKLGQGFVHMTGTEGIKP